MKRVQIVLEQAQVLRRLSETFDDPAVKRQMLEMADRCDELAASMEEAVTRARDKVEPPSIH